MGIFSMSGRATRAAALVAVGLALALAAGCSDDGGDDAAAEDGGGVFPVSIDHAHGTTTITAAPERVVTVGVNEQDAVLAMGIVPVGVTEWYGGHPFATWPWAQDELGDGEPTVLNTTDGLQFERIAALRPDLIIGTNAGLKKEDYDRLSAIAPTIAHGADGPLYFQPWDSDAMMIGRALGKEAEMQALVDDIKGRFQEAAAEHPEFAGKTAVFLQNAIYEGRAIAYQEGLSTAFLTDLGFAILPGLERYQQDGGQAYIPVERLSILDDADVLLWATEKPSDRTALEEVPLYNRLEEVREGRLVFTDDVTAGAIYFTSVLSLPHVLDRLVPVFASTLAGEGPAVIE
jgi:iron complex transport system substrate-binding protein